MRRREDDLLAWRDDPVVQALQSPGTAEELAGIDAPAALFRQLHGGRRSRRRFVGHVGTGVTTVVVVLGLSGGVAAAYDRVLPDPLQSAMHALLGPVGVPDANPPHPSAAGEPGSGTHRPRHRPHGAVTSVPIVPASSSGPRAPVKAAPPAPASAPSTAAPAATATPAVTPSATPAPTDAAPTTAAPATTPSTAPPAAPAALTATAGRTRVPADQRTTLHGTLQTSSGEPVAGHRVYLQQRDPGSTTWTRVASGRTASDGTVALRSPALAHNVALRLVTPQGLHSDAVAVTVVPQITTSVTLSGDHRHYVVTVSVAGAQSGDYVVLARHGSDGWTTLHRVRLPDTMQVSWSVPVPAAQQVHYRVRVPRTQEHAEADRYFSVAPAQ